MLRPSIVWFPELFTLTLLNPLEVANLRSCQDCCFRQCQPTHSWQTSLPSTLATFLRRLLLVLYLQFGLTRLGFQHFHACLFHQQQRDLPPQRVCAIQDCLVSGWVHQTTLGNDEARPLHPSIQLPLEMMRFSFLLLLCQLLTHSGFTWSRLLLFLHLHHWVGYDRDCGHRHDQGNNGVVEAATPWNFSISSLTSFFMPTTPTASIDRSWTGTWFLLQTSHPLGSRRCLCWTKSAFAQSSPCCPCYCLMLPYSWTSSFTAWLERLASVRFWPYCPQHW